MAKQKKPKRRGVNGGQLRAIGGIVGPAKQKRFTPSGSATLGGEVVYEPLRYEKASSVPASQQHVSPLLMPPTTVGALKETLPSNSEIFSDLGAAALSQSIDRQRLSPGDVLRPYYKDIPGGLASAATKATRYNATEGVDYPMLQYAPEVDFSKENLARPRTEYLTDMPPGIGGATYLDIDGYSLGSSFGPLTQARNREHELGTHALMTKPSYKAPWDTSKSARSPWKERPHEVDANILGPVKRMYAKYTGKLVTTPAEADKAIDWLEEQKMAWWYRNRPPTPLSQSEDYSDAMNRVIADDKKYVGAWKKLSPQDQSNLEYLFNTVEDVFPYNPGTPVSIPLPEGIGRQMKRRVFKRTETGLNIVPFEGDSSTEAKQFREYIRQRMPGVVQSDPLGTLPADQAFVAQAMLGGSPPQPAAAALAKQQAQENIMPLTSSRSPRTVPPESPLTARRRRTVPPFGGHPNAEAQRAHNRTYAEQLAETQQLNRVDMEGVKPTDDEAIGAQLERQRRLTLGEPYSDPLSAAAFREDGRYGDDPSAPTYTQSDLAQMFGASPVTSPLRTASALQQTSQPQLLSQIPPAPPLFGGPNFMQPEQSRMADQLIRQQALEGLAPPQAPVPLGFDGPLQAPVVPPPLQQPTRTVGPFVQQPAVTPQIATTSPGVDVPPFGQTPGDVPSRFDVLEAPAARAVAANEALGIDPYNREVARLTTLQEEQDATNAALYPHVQGVGSPAVSNALTRQGVPTANVLRGATEAHRALPGMWQPDVGAPKGSPLAARGQAAIQRAKDAAEQAKVDEAKLTAAFEKPARDDRIRLAVEAAQRGERAPLYGGRGAAGPLGELGERLAGTAKLTASAPDRDERIKASKSDRKARDAERQHRVRAKALGVSPGVLSLQDALQSGTPLTQDQNRQLYGTALDQIEAMREGNVLRAKAEYLSNLAPGQDPNQASLDALDRRGGVGAGTGPLSADPASNVATITTSPDGQSTVSLRDRPWFYGQGKRKQINLADIEDVDGRLMYKGFEIVKVTNSMDGSTFYVRKDRAPWLDMRGTHSGR